MKTRNIKIAWMTDLHLDRATNKTRLKFLTQLSTADFECAVVTGDISESERLVDDLSSLTEACGKRKIYFVLGNHDFFGSTFQAVDHEVSQLCHRTSNLVHLGNGTFQKLSPSLGLLGHRGWADARAG